MKQITTFIILFASAIYGISQFNTMSVFQKSFFTVILGFLISTIIIVMMNKIEEKKNKND